MTYFETAKNIIELYTQYVYDCGVNEYSHNDYAEAVVIAVEALLIRANQEKIEATQKQYLTNLADVAIPTPITTEIHNLINREVAELGELI